MIGAGVRRLVLVLVIDILIFRLLEKRNRRFMPRVMGFRCRFLLFIHFVLFQPLEVRSRRRFRWDVFGSMSSGFSYFSFFRKILVKIDPLDLVCFVFCCVGKVFVQHHKGVGR